jgi:fructose-1,6-bisphosphatase/sedoheptulose 1,7-bisphosphatase-like protein
MRGVRFFGGGHRVTSLVMSRGERLIRFIDSVHTEEGADIVVEF